MLKLLISFWSSDHATRPSGPAVFLFDQNNILILKDGSLVILHSVSCSNRFHDLTALVKPLNAEQVARRLNYINTANECDKIEACCKVNKVKGVSANKCEVNCPNDLTCAFWYHDCSSNPSLESFWDNLHQQQKAASHSPNYTRPQKSSNRIYLFQLCYVVSCYVNYKLKWQCENVDRFPTINISHSGQKETTDTESYKCDCCYECNCSVGLWLACGLELGPPVIKIILACIVIDTCWSHC